MQRLFSCLHVLAAQSCVGRSCESAFQGGVSVTTSQFHWDISNMLEQHGASTSVCDGGMSFLADLCAHRSALDGHFSSQDLASVDTEDWDDDTLACLAAHSPENTLSFSISTYGAMCSMPEVPRTRGVRLARSNQVVGGLFLHQQRWSGDPTQAPPSWSQQAVQGRGMCDSCYASLAAGCTGPAVERPAPGNTLDDDGSTGSSTSSTGSSTGPFGVDPMFLPRSQLFRPLLANISWWYNTSGGGRGGQLCWLPVRLLPCASARWAYSCTVVH